MCLDRNARQPVRLLGTRGGTTRSSEWRWTYFCGELATRAHSVLCRHHLDARMTSLLEVVSFQLYSSVPLRRCLTLVGCHLHLWSIAGIPYFNIKLHFDYVLYFIMFRVSSEFVCFQRYLCFITIISNLLYNLTNWFLDDFTYLFKIVLNCGVPIVSFGLCLYLGLYYVTRLFYTDAIGLEKANRFFKKS